MPHALSHCGLCIVSLSLLTDAIFFFPSNTVNAADEKDERVWHAAWNEQNDLLVWPKGYGEPESAALNGLSFGTDLADKDRIRGDFIKISRDEYKQLVEELQPLTFRDDWTKMLRCLPPNSKLPTAEETWLSLEDLWLQREILASVRRVNIEAAKFKRVKSKGSDDPKNRSFRSPIWQVELRIVEKDGKAMLAGNLTNVTDRLQILGIRNSMKLNVWLSADARQPFVFEIEGTAVEAGKMMPIKQLESHIVPGGLRAVEIARVEQEFDLRTAPIKRIENLAVGKVGERQNKEPLLISKLSSKAAANEKTKLYARTPNGLERRRYLHVSNAMRRLPFGIVVVADQAYMKNLLEEFGRSKLRFQITQSEWARFRGTLTFAQPPVAKGPNAPSPEVDGPANNREDPNAPGLIEASIYGVASLYEKYPADKPIPNADPKGEKKTLAQSGQNWLRIHELINRSLPIPGPDGNMLTDQRRLWDFATDKQDGRRAVAKYFERMRQGVDPRAAVAGDDLHESLATVDIEAVHNRFTSNLKGLYENAADYQRRYVDPEDIFGTMVEEDRKKPPEGEGWVFEIRGTTWYDVSTVKGKDFIRRTLLANLQREAKNPKLVTELKSKISHIFLYNVWRDSDPRPDTFRFIHASLIDFLMPAPTEEMKGGFFRPIGMLGAVADVGGPKAQNPQTSGQSPAPLRIRNCLYLEGRSFNCSIRIQIA